ncbi:RES family NAD+ phosphorylase [Caulobacter sp. LARHSG274]
MRKMTTSCRPAQSLEPKGEIGPFLPIAADEVEVFNDILSDELDSSFASSIGCCDFCYDSFKARWPNVAFRNLAFQRNAMDARWAVDYSRLPGIYSEAEISTLRHLVQCPRCLEHGACNIWLYEHRFSDVEAIERDIDTLLAIARRTPFLILTHPFAVQVLEEVKRQAQAAVAAPIDRPLYRARFAEDVARLGQDPDALETFGPAPARYVGEGRFNHAGAPMVYLADAAETAAAEMGAPGALCHVARLRLIPPLKVLDLNAIEEDAPGFDILGAVTASALLAAPRTGEGWVKRQYAFSRFVADCALSAGFDAICYGSIKSRDAANYVILAPPDAVDQLAAFEDRQDLVCPEPARRW